MEIAGPRCDAATAGRRNRSPVTMLWVTTGVPVMVMVPLYDNNTLRFIPFQIATTCLIVLNVLAFLYQLSLGERGIDISAMQAGMIPVALFGAAELPPEFRIMSPEYTLVTYMFLHGDWMHLIGNMLFLWVFGDNVEDAMGSISFVVFYLLSGIAAGLAHAYMNFESQAPLIGASGATAGVIGAYLMLYPRVSMWALVLMRLPLRLPAWLIIGAWLATQFFFIFTGINDGTAWWAHLGGFAAGVLLVVMFKRPSVPLFGGAPPP
jgi:membrane associated rhomboid family serine protease